MPSPYYEHAGITIFHGDCREILPELGRFDLLLTDPPYGIALTNHGMSDSDYTIAGDESLDAAIFVLDWAKRLGTPTAAFSSPWKPLPGYWRNLLVWDKGDSVGAGGDPQVCFKRTWELIQIRDNSPLLRGRDGSVLRFPTCSYDFRDHPAAKPVELMAYLIAQLLNTGTLADPFMGSGTTLVAAKNLGHKAIGIELEEKYCEIAAKRLSQEVLQYA